MNDLHQMTREILEDCLPDSLITDADRELLARNVDFLLGLEDEVVKAFYDTLFSHAATAAIFEDGERPKREETLRGWWRRTVTSGLDEKYFEWMAYVGIVHIRRGISNAMMSTMLQLVVQQIGDACTGRLGPEAGIPIAKTFMRLQSTVTALMTEAHTRGYVGALQSVAGLRPELTARLLDMEIADMEKKARAAL